MTLYMKVRVGGAIIGYRRDNVIQETIKVRDLEHAREVVKEANYEDSDMQNSVISAVVYPGKMKLV